jgi:hypothetical protein
VQLAIATGTGPEAWGLEPDFATVATFELELQMQAEEARRGH